MSRQEYDASIKGLIFEEAEELIQCLLPGAVLLGVTDVEVLNPPMRVDRLYRVLYRGKVHILHLEFQATTDEDMAHRLLVYHANIWRDHKLPVITIVVYLFQASVPTSPLREFSGDQEILTFHFHVLKLWKIDAHQYMENNVKCMYTLLPMLQNADATLVLQVIDRLSEIHKDDEARLGRRLLWLRTFLERAEVLSPQDKAKVRKRLEVFQQLLEQSEFARQQRALGRAEGEAKGELRATQGLIAELVSLRFPSLSNQVQQTAKSIATAEELHALFRGLLYAPDEETAQQILTVLKKPAR